jgi:uncharacterized protein (DUF2252 family)
VGRVELVWQTSLLLAAMELTAFSAALTQPVAVAVEAARLLQWLKTAARVVVVREAPMAVVGLVLLDRETMVGMGRRLVPEVAVVLEPLVKMRRSRTAVTVVEDLRTASAVLP